MIKKIITQATFFGVLFIVISGCANMNSMLLGGAKDVSPPKLVISIPELNAKNFKGKKIEITFDEFIKLNDINKQLVISTIKEKTNCSAT